MSGRNENVLASLISEESEKACASARETLRRLEGQRILLTGATGLIGAAFVRAILFYNRTAEKPVGLVLPVRSIEKAERLFPDAAHCELIRADVTEPLTVDGPVDHVIHGAGITSSRAFVERPDEVLETLFAGALSTLRLAREKQAKGYLLLSTMEIYGAPSARERIGEKHGADMDTMSARSSYPEGKRAAEALAAAYAARYGLSAKVLRLTQTYGPGVDYEDARMFQSFARCAAEGRDIVLFTKGETSRSYLYTADAVSAMLTALVSGEPGEAYNAANEESYCSVLEMAQAVAARSKRGCRVRVEERDTAAMGYAPVLYMDLDTAKLRALGWRPAFGPEEMLSRLVAAAEAAYEGR